jgi:hypothetical protein
MIKGDTVNWARTPLGQGPISLHITSYIRILHAWLPWPRSISVQQGGLCNDIVRLKRLYDLGFNEHLIFLGIRPEFDDIGSRISG